MRFTEAVAVIPLKYDDDEKLITFFNVTVCVDVVLENVYVLFVIYA